MSSKQSSLLIVAASDLTHVLCLLRFLYCNYNLPQYDQSINLPKRQLSIFLTVEALTYHPLLSTNYPGTRIQATNLIIKNPSSFHPKLRNSSYNHQSSHAPSCSLPLQAQHGRPHNLKAEHRLSPHSRTYPFSTQLPASILTLTGSTPPPPPLRAPPKEL